MLLLLLDALVLLLLLFHEEASGGVQVGVGLGLGHVTQIAALIGRQVDACQHQIIQLIQLIQLNYLAVFVCLFVLTLLAPSVGTFNN